MKITNTIICFSFLIILIIIPLIYSDKFEQDTETNFTSWTFSNTNMTGVGKDANITLNWTYLSGGGCAECGNMRRGQKNYTLRGNASKVFDTGSTTSKHDKILWESDLPNVSNIVG